MSAAQSVLSSIQHYQRSIQKSHGNASRILHCINRLYHLPITVQHLQDTGVGKTINSLRKSDGEVGDAAKALVLKWKQMVEEESENEQDSATDEFVNANYNGAKGNESNRDKYEKRLKGHSEKSSKSQDNKEQSRTDHSKSNKRKSQSEYEHYKDKKYKYEDVSDLNIEDSISSSIMKSSFNGDILSDEDWSNKLNNELNNGDENNTISSSEIEKERVPYEDPIAESLENDLNSTEFAVGSQEEPWHRKEDLGNHQHDKSSKRDKSSSHRHKSKGSSSSSDKSKHSSAMRDEHKETRSLNKHKDERSSSGSSMLLSKKDESSSIAGKSEGKSKNKEKDKKERNKDKYRSKDEKKSKDTKDKEKGNTDEDGVDSFSGKSFGEALGMMFPPEKSRKKSSGSSSLVSSPKKKNRSSNVEDVDFAKGGNHLSPKMEQKGSPASKILSLEVDEDFGLPALNPNYKPLPQPNFFNSPPKRFQNEDEDDLSNIMYSKAQRTKVYSGNKTGYTFVPSLFNLCTRVLQENIDALEYTGGVPFDLLKPVLERANPEQLFNLEHYNAYLIEDTDMLWEYHCKKDFRTKKREEMETWREMYMRCREERENKLKSLTANIAAASKAKALPVRKTQMAYVVGNVKPPRNIARKQAKFGTARPTTSSSTSPPSSSSSSSSKQGSSGLSSSFTGRPSTIQPSGPSVMVPAPRGSGGSGTQSNSCKPKPKAPLMQKTLQFMKLNRFGKR